MKADLTRYNICDKDGNTYEEIDDYGDYVEFDDAETIIGNLEDRLEEIQDLLEQALVKVEQ